MRHRRHPLRPRLKLALRMVPRDERTLQFGLHPARAVVLTDVEPPVRRLIESLDGTRTLAEATAASGVTEITAQETVALLAARGLVDDAAMRPVPMSELTRAERDRMRPDLEALSLAADDGGAETFARRRRAQVRVHGGGRVGAQIAALLAAAGVGHLCVVDPSPATHEDVVPGGLTWDDKGSPREDGVVAAIRSIAPGANAWPGRTASRIGDGGRRPDLVVLAPDGTPDLLLAGELTDLGIPHLLVTCYEGCGSVGPLVEPARTACVGCVELARRDRDPDRPAGRARGWGAVACETTLSALVAAQGAGHALAFIDRRGPIVSNGTLDVFPDWRWRYKAWERHPRCRCGRNDLAALTMVA